MKNKSLDAVLLSTCLHSSMIAEHREAHCLMISSDGTPKLVGLDSKHHARTPRHQIARMLRLHPSFNFFLCRNISLFLFNSLLLLLLIIDRDLCGRKKCLTWSNHCLTSLLQRKKEEQSLESDAQLLTWRRLENA